MEKRSLASWAGGGRGRGGAEALPSQLFPIPMSASLRICRYPCIFAFCFFRRSGHVLLLPGAPGRLPPGKGSAGGDRPSGKSRQKTEKRKIEKRIRKKDIPMYAGASTPPHRDPAIHPFIPFFLDPPVTSAFTNTPFPFFSSFPGGSSLFFCFADYDFRGDGDTLYKMTFPPRKGGCPEESSGTGFQLVFHSRMDSS